jgi:O-Antigen ligase
VRSLAAADTGASRSRPFALPAGVSPGAVVLAVTLPLVFLHLRFQPAVVVGAVTFKLSDAAVLATAVAAAWAAARRGLAPLRPGIPVWITGVALFLWIGAAVLYPLASSTAYAWKTHLVTAGEFAEYALLAPAVPLLVRRRGDALVTLGSLVAWTVVAAVVGVVQFAGWNIVDGWGQARREPSFLGPQDFAAVSGMTLGLGLVALLWGARGRLRTGAWVALVAGLVGFILGGATSGLIGLVPAVAVAIAVTVRRGIAQRAALVCAVAVTAVSAIGVVALRSGDFGQFFSLLGMKKSSPAATKNIETYPQRTLLAYIGFRIWLDHPIVGAGFEASKEPATFMPALPAAHRRFPHVAAIAFPGPDRIYGVQDLYIQVLADLGIVGFGLLVALFGAGLWPAFTTSLRGPPTSAFPALLGVVWILLALGFLTGQGIIAGIPLDAVTWLGFGAAVTRLGAEAW